MKRIKSKKFVVYFYQGGKGGGNICVADERGKLSRKSYPFHTKEDGMKTFEELVDLHLQSESKKEDKDVK